KYYIKYENGKVEFWGRRLEKHPNWTKNLSYLIPYLEDLPPGTLLDSELYSTKGRRGIPSVMAKTGFAKPIIYVFDVVFFNETFVGEKQLRERKSILKGILLKPPFYFLEYKPLEDWENALKETLKMGFEGIVIKNLESPYLISKSAPVATHYWRKIKG
ncbi:MAG: hypothetical protein C0169_05520, partial [Thermodesulfobacterium geofontis]